MDHGIIIESFVSYRSEQGRNIMVRSICDPIDLVQPDPTPLQYLYTLQSEYIRHHDHDGIEFTTRLVTVRGIARCHHDRVRYCFLARH